MKREMLQELTRAVEAPGSVDAQAAMERALRDRGLEPGSV